MAALLPRHGRTSCASSSTWMWARPTAGSMADMVSAAEIVRLIDAELPIEPIEAQLPRRSGRTLAVQRRRRRDRHHRLGHPALLRRLHPRPALFRRATLHLPVRRAQAPTSARCCAAGSRTRRSPPWCARSGGHGPTATPRYARRPPPVCRRSRCRTSADNAPHRVPPGPPGAHTYTNTRGSASQRIAYTCAHSNG